MYLKYGAYDTIKKTWIIPHEAFEVFGWTFLDGFEFDVLKWLTVLEDICLP